MADLFACVYAPGGGETSAAATPDSRHGLPATLEALVHDFSPRYESYGADLMMMDASGLGRLFGDARAIGEALRSDAIARGLRVHVAVACTQTTALVLARWRPGLTVVPPGEERAALASLPITVLESKRMRQPPRTARSEKARSGPSGGGSNSPELAAFRMWGLKTLGELAALPSSDLAARLGRTGLAYQAVARGEDVRPLVPMIANERFESSLELEWPIDGLDPLSFVLTRLLEPLSTRLERRDRGAAALHVILDLVDGETHVRRLELPSPLRDVRTLRTLALLDLEARPPSAAIDRVTVVIEPTPARVWQHTLFARPHPTPEQLSTLLARLGALMGQDRIGTATVVDTHRPGAFVMTPFPPDVSGMTTRGCSGTSGQTAMVRALRRYRQPVPVRVALDGGRPARVTSDRRGLTGGRVLRVAGPWRVSGEWWNPQRYGRDEWDVELGDGALCRIFRDCETDRWFVDALID